MMNTTYNTELTTQPPLPGLKKLAAGAVAGGLALVVAGLGGSIAYAAPAPTPTPPSITNGPLDPCPGGHAWWCNVSNVLKDKERNAQNALSNMK